MLDNQTIELTYGKPLTFLLYDVLGRLKGISEDITTDLIVKKMIEYRPAVAELTKEDNSRILLLQRIRSNISQFQKSGLVSIETKKSITKTNYLVIHLNF